MRALCGGGGGSSVGGSTRVNVFSERKGPWWSCVAAGRQSLLLSHTDAVDGKIDEVIMSRSQISNKTLSHATESVVLKLSKQKEAPKHILTFLESL